MKFKIEKLIKEDGKTSAIAVGVINPVHATIFDIPSNVKQGSIVNASSIEKGGPVKICILKIPIILKG